MPEFRGNSDKALANAHNNEPRGKQAISDDDIVDVNAPKSDFQEFLELFLPEDPKTLKRSILVRLADGIKTMISDAINSFLF